MSSKDEFATTPAWDERWVERLKSLETSAWDELMKMYSDELRTDNEKSVRKRGAPLDTASDIEQETWLTAVRKINEFQWDAADKLYHWLRVIALNHIRMMMRRPNQEMVSL